MRGQPNQHGAGARRPAQHARRPALHARFQDGGDQLGTWPGGQRGPPLRITARRHSHHGHCQRDRPDTGCQHQGRTDHGLDARTGALCQRLPLLYVRTTANWAVGIPPPPHPTHRHRKPPPYPPPTHTLTHSYTQLSFQAYGVWDVDRPGQAAGTHPPIRSLELEPDPRWRRGVSCRQRVSDFRSIIATVLI